MGGLWHLAWRRVVFCGWPWNHLGNPPGLRRGRLGTSRRPGLAVQLPRRPKSTNPYTRSQEENWRRWNKTVLTCGIAAAVGLPGGTGLGGSAVAGHATDQIENMVPGKDRIIKVTFNADVHAKICVVPGETALAFHKTKNPTDKPVMGISTYSVCFCFEEQRLNPQEEVNMPVFFYIDPEFAEDSRMVNVDLITLSYTFFFF
ncbi:hypothetical protein FD755_018718 [Muntiacus reevesi]|uniref:Cytochrome c oxidase assembly protein COX11, mitochondrial n=1 Tax=Muntiacus reevesi TaxID=9886 RepID=A0A5N3X7N0_MUNRE|nr:hypothetical protein FD755_018718 [Muntiacus reevesi]